MMRAFIMALVLTLGALPAFAVLPDEVLDDPALEARARELSKGLRCLVCQNESIDESNASLARDLRLLVRERLTEGDSDEEVMDYVVARYGEFVLLKPTTGGANWLLWASGPILFLLGAGIGVAYVRGRSKPDGSEADARLSDAEQTRLNEILAEESPRG